MSAGTRPKQRRGYGTHRGRLAILHAEEDRKLARELIAHLAPLELNGSARIWHPGSMAAGAPLGPTARAEIRRADLLLLLLSAHFFSAACWDNAAVRLARRLHSNGATRIVPVVARPCYWEESPFAGLLPLPRSGKPVTLWWNRDAALRDVVAGVSALLRGSEPRSHEDRGSAARPTKTCPDGHVRGAARTTPMNGRRALKNAPLPA